jgi:cytochrome c oxidase subunit 4
MAHSHGHAGDAAVHAKDFVPVPAVHPAGASDSASHHGHTIMSATTLLIVLLALVGLTILTVGAALIEAWVVETFHVQPEIATFVNVAICLAIAAVKTTLVVLFFMQLKYDNPINGMIFVFCMVTVATFLGFTMLDLGNRGSIDRFKSGYVQEGGQGLATSAFKSAMKSDSSLQPTKPITALAKDAAVINREFHEDHAHGGGHGHGKPKSPYSTPNQSRPIRGIPDRAPAPAEEHH